MLEKKTILFVDDEIKILQALRRKVHKWKSNWEIEYCTSGQEALEIFKSKKVAVLITDMKMPGMTGFELLDIVSKLYPETIRFILSGQTDKAVLMKSFKNIHQYFSKPCDTEELFQTIYRIFNIRSFLEDKRLKSVVTQMRSLPVLPVTYTELEKEMRSDSSSLKKMAEILAKDVAISAKILQLANSSYFVMRKQTSDLQQAISIIGLDSLKDLVLTISLFNQVEPAIIGKFNLLRLWEHSFRVAVKAKWISGQLGLSDLDTELCFIGGLLHDIGKLIFAMEFPVSYQEIFQKYQGDKSHSLESLEYQSFSASHAETGAYLTSLWGFNDIITESILFHHKLSEVTSNSILPVVIVHLANYLDHKIYLTEQTMKDISESRVCYDKTVINRLKLEKKLSDWERYFEKDYDRH